MMHDVRWEELEEVTTDHARKRMNQRGITTAAIDLALRYGLADYRNGALRYTIGRKESARYRDIEPRLVRYHGVHVVCASDGGQILTTYRNKNFARRKHKRTQFTS